MPMEKPLILKGQIIDTPTRGEFRVREDHFLISRQGKVDSVCKSLPQEYKRFPVRDQGKQLIIPSFIDLHLHAPQFLQRGIGLDLQLIDWLEGYTFLSEREFADPDYARKMYPPFVDELLSKGSLRSCIFGTIHNQSNDILVELLQKKGLIAYVGKVNMDQNSPEGLLEKTRLSLEDTEAFLLKHKDNRNIKPILTPRFAPSCSRELMDGLGKLARKYQVPIQSHISENRLEVEWVKQLFPEEDSYSEVYHHHGLLQGKETLMAHGIYLTTEERELLKKNRCRVIHCPEANLNLASGILPITEFLDQGMLLGLGSDVGAGQTLAMYRVMVRAVQSSKTLASLNPEKESPVLKLSEAFYLGTRGNGTFWGEVGCFDPGFSTDLLVISDPLGEKMNLPPLDRLQRFIYTGDDRNITGRFLEGREL